jgi:uncharacterized protein (DUF1330 family)
MLMSVYAIAQASVDDQETLDEYVAAAMPILQAHRVKILAFDETPTMIEGSVEHPRTVILEFESERSFHDWYGSPEYQAARKLRENASRGTFILVTGLD